MKSFQDIENLALKILDTDQAIFFGVDHEDTFFHEYLVTIILNLRKKYPIYFLIEADDEYIQSTLKEMRKFIGEQERKYSDNPNAFMLIMAEVKKFLVNQKAQFPILTASLADYYKVVVKGVDVPLEETAELHNPDTELERLKVLITERSLKQGYAIADNIQKELQKEKNSKFIVLGGPMHGDVPAQLSIQSVNVLENNCLKKMTKRFSSLSYMQELASDRNLAPSYTFFFAIEDVCSSKVAETKVTVELPLLGKEWTPAYSVAHEGLEGLFKQYKLIDKSKDQLEKGLRNAANSNNVKDVQIFIEAKADINAPSPSNGRTALHYAAANGLKGCVRLLLNFKADPSIKGGAHQDPYCSTQNPAIKELLSQAPAPGGKK